MATKWKPAPYGTGDIWHGWIARSGKRTAWVKWEGGFETIGSRVLRDGESWPICGPRVRAHRTLYGAMRSAEYRLRPGRR